MPTLITCSRKTLKTNSSMKANELMIGDWVEVIQNGNPAYAQIQMIDGYGDNATYNECICDGIYYNINEIKPIPLTTEILKKNGWIVWKANKMGVLIFNQHFEFSDNLLGIKDTIESRIDCDPYGDFHYMCNGKSFCYINSVHELQHVLPLLGIDKEIEL